jgi:hypothetical protein
MDCEWKHCFNTSKKQGHSHEVLAFREIGRGHSAMTTFNKVMNMPAPPARDFDSSTIFCIYIEHIISNNLMFFVFEIVTFLEGK